MKTTDTGVEVFVGTGRNRQKILMQGWRKVDGKYVHSSGRKVFKDANSSTWEVVGGRNDGFRWMTMSTAMHFALK